MTHLSPRIASHAASHAVDRVEHPVVGLERRTSIRVRLALALVIVALAALVGYVAGFAAYGFVAGASEYLAQEQPSAACHTPESRFGWPYEAINYDRRDDAWLMSFTPDPDECGYQGARAGSDVLSADGTPIAGWYIPAASGQGPEAPTVVLVHGGKANKSGMLEYAPPLHPDYNLVILDLRNSGRSGGTQSTGGLFERRDLQAMIDWLVQAKRPDWIAVLGNSNGAATALAEAVHDVRVRALVLDSMHASVETQLANILVSERGLPAWPGAAAIVAGVSARLGQDLASVDPIRMLPELEGRPILFTHGSADHVDRPEQSLDRNVAAARAAGLEVRVEVCAGADHGLVVAVCGNAWAGWVLDFLAAARLGASGG